MQCQECGMEVEQGEYHPYAACLMFKASKSGSTVRANLNAVHNHAINSISFPSALRKMWSGDDVQKIIDSAKLAE